MKMVWILLLLVSSIQVKAQVLITDHNTDFTTSLNGWNGTLPTGFTRTGANYVGTSELTNGGVYAIPNAGFGYQPSSSSPATSCSLTGTYKNTTGGTITSLQISYQAFQIVNRASRLPNWTVTSSLGNVSALNWTFNASTSPSSPSNLTVTLTGLNLANNATFTLTFSSDRGLPSGSSPMIGVKNIKVKSIAAVCNAPVVLPATGLTHEAAELHWNAVAGSSGYQYVIDETLGDPTGAGIATTATDYSASGLTPSTSYYVHVRTVCGSSFSAWTTVSFGTDYPPCADPTNLAADNITDTEADLSWNAITGVAGFEYTVNEIATAPTLAGTVTTGNTYDASGLIAHTTYYLHVRTNCTVNMSEWITIPFTTDYTPCQNPATLAANNITDTEADLSWGAITGVAGFEYTVNEIATAPTVAGTVTTGNTYDATGLIAHTTYYLHVRTNCTVNMSEWITIPFTTDYTPCQNPATLAANNITDTEADLSWDAITGVTGFEYTVNEIATAPTVAGTVTTGNTYDASGLTAHTTYYLHVRTNCTVNMSEWITIPFTTDYTPCQDPSGLATANLTDMEADLSWNAITGAAGFEYTVNEVATAPTVAGTATTDPAYNATGLTAHTTYYLHVRTNCTVNMSEWITLPFTTDYTPCQIPTALTASNINATGANLTWNAIAGITGFEYTINQEGTAPTVAGTAITSASVPATDLNPNTTYYLHLRTNCGVNLSEWVVLQFTTGYLPCQNPTGMSATNVTATGAKLSWDAASGATGYEYVINQTATAPSMAGTGTTLTSYTATNLTPNTTYFMHLRKNCGVNFSNWITLSFTTLSTAGIEDINFADLKLFPNPVVNTLNITAENAGKIELINLNGQILQTILLTEKSLQVDMTPFEAGLYFVRYSKDNLVTTRQIIKH